MSCVSQAARRGTSRTTDRDVIPALLWTPSRSPGKNAAARGKAVSRQPASVAPTGARNDFMLCTT